MANSDPMNLEPGRYYCAICGNAGSDEDFRTGCFRCGSRKLYPQRNRRISISDLQARPSRRLSTRCQDVRDFGELEAEQ